MKTSLSLCLALVAVTSVRAQVFRPEAVNGAVWGSIAGAVIGHNSGDLRHNAWKGAAIGAGAGLLLGQAVGDANAARGTTVYASGDGYPVYRSAPVVHVGVGYGRGDFGYRHGYYPRHGYHPRGGFGYGYYAPRHDYGYWPSYSYYGGYGVDYPYYGSYGSYGSASGASNGLVLGALAGGIIGHNSGSLHHNGWRGAAWGAGLGWLLGTISDANRRTVASAQPVPVVSQPAAVVAPAPVEAASPQPHALPVVNKYFYNASTTPMSAANGLFGR